MHRMAVALVVSLCSFAACKEHGVSATMDGGKPFRCPDLTSVTECEERMRLLAIGDSNAVAKKKQEDDEKQKKEKIDALMAAVDADYAAYDAQPTHDKPTLLATLAKAKARLTGAPDWAILERKAYGAARKRMAPLFGPRAATTAKEDVALVPDPSEDVCKATMPKWLEDDDMSRAMAAVRYETAICGAQIWKLHLDLARCYAYVKGADGKKRPDQVMVWRTLGTFEEKVDAGAKLPAKVDPKEGTLIPAGTKLLISDRGEGYLGVQGVEKLQALTGFVQPEICHYAEPK